MLRVLNSMNVNPDICDGQKRKGKEMFYLTTYSTHFIYGYMASDDGQGRTALMHAFLGGQLVLVVSCSMGNAGMNMADLQGNSALVHAIKGKNIKIIIVFTQRGRRSPSDQTEKHDG